MKSLQKYIFLIFCTMALLLLAVFAAEREDAESPYFCIQNEYGRQNISIYDARDGNYYVFLPSYAKMEQVQVILPPIREYFLDDVALSNQMTCDAFELERPYKFTADGEKLATLWFYQSRNIATMYLDTVSGKMTDIHNDKSHEEYASLTVYAPDGRIDHYDDSSRLKGRGNYTWLCDKRPYLLTLSSDSDLLGMGAAKKWVLLANAYDETNLNNKVVYDLAGQIEFGWSPDCQFVDLYLNGEYRGLYLLAEKIEVHDNRLNLDADSGEFLCRIDLWERWDQLQNPFESSMGRAVEISYPEVLPDADFDYVTYLVYLLEQDFQSGTDLRNSAILDLDSWVRRYLMDEISGNIDADLASSYFYYSGGKFFAGPVWDYDIAFGNSLRNQNPRSFLAKNEHKAAWYSSPYYSALYANASFFNRMVEIYRTEFVPVLQKLIHHDLDAQIDMIRNASQMNSIRWRSMYNELTGATPGTVRFPDDLKEYLIDRIRFLDSAWLENVDYCTVQFMPPTGLLYWNISVEKGTCLDTQYMDLENTVWIDQKTGLPVDFRCPLTAATPACIPRSSREM